MRKSTRIAKRALALILVVLMSINTLGAIVSDNDGSAFITKAEFDSMKNDFQSQIDQYNTSIDSKIDGAIASYLAGIQTSRFSNFNSLLDKKIIWLEMIGKDAALGWCRPEMAVSMYSSANVWWFQTNIASTDSWRDQVRNGTIISSWSPKNYSPNQKELYTFDKVTQETNGNFLNPRKTKRYLNGNVSVNLNSINATTSRYMTTNWGLAMFGFGNIMYNQEKTVNGNIYDIYKDVDWQSGLCWGHKLDSIPFSYKAPNAYPNNPLQYAYATADGEDAALVWSSRPNDGNLVNLTVATGLNSNYMMGAAGTHIQSSLQWVTNEENMSLLGLVGTGEDRPLQFFDNESNNLRVTHARTVKHIAKEDLKYNITGRMFLYGFELPYKNGWYETNKLYMDVTNSYETKDIVLDTGITPWYNAADTKWPNTIPYDFLISSVYFNKALDKSKLAYYNRDIINVDVSTTLSNYLKNYSWNRGFPMWEVDDSGILSFEPIFKNTTDTYLVWCLKGPSDSNVPFETAPTNYYSKNSKCTLTQITSGDGKGAIKCKSGNKIIIDDVNKGDIVYLYFTTLDGKAGVSLKNGIQATLEII
ncbi:MAG: hypothetical protein J6P02_06105 [Lachnospiraceae bacterium]|nr:hypothetical protein [Lachnospiraceae bacterium]